MDCYISKENVEASVEYFRNAGFESDDMLFLFLMSKHFGVSLSSPVTYLVGKLSDIQKKEYLNTIWMLGGLFDSNEECGKRGLLFPTAFNKVAFYQPGTEFSGVLGRIKDTIEKKNINIPIYADNGSMLTLKSNYRDLIQENYLRGQKISLSNFAAWILRFTKFDFNQMPNDKQFSRVVEKTVKKLFKITKNDFLWLFENDLSINRVSASTTSVTGNDVRQLFTFEPGKTPEIQTLSVGTPGQMSVVVREIVEKYLSLNGDNPSNGDILDILKTKRQIVLTGVPGVGKSRYTQELCSDPFFAVSKTIQFHASYSYEDFIGAEVLRTEDAVTYVTTKIGSFLDIAIQAAHNPDKNYLFVIDELNRGNIAEIFGETILALDRNYEVALNREYFDNNYGTIKTMKIPENLYIVATMNTSDRNIAFLDLAIRRRFGFVNLFPNYDFLSEEVVLDGVDVGNVLKLINQRILDTLRDPELVLGQSYFIPAKSESGYEWTWDKFKNQFNFVLLPTIKEYSFNEPAAVNTIIGESLGDAIQDVDEFRTAFIAEFSA